MRFASIVTAAATLLLTATAVQAGNPGKGYPTQYPTHSQPKMYQQQVVPAPAPPQVEYKVQHGTQSWQHVAPKQKPTQYRFQYQQKFRPMPKPYPQVQPKQRIYQQQTAKPQPMPQYVTYGEGGIY